MHKLLLFFCTQPLTAALRQFDERIVFKSRNASRAFIGLFLLALALPAQADWFQTWVGAVCDPQSGRGLVRFGYGDANDPGTFLNFDDPVIGGLTKLPVKNADKTDAWCSFPSGREIRIRYEMGDQQGDTRGPWSVWVDKKKIIERDTRVAYPYLVIVEPNAFRQCWFNLSEDQDPYDFTETKKRLLPDQVKPVTFGCDEELTPIRGTRDLVEYPKAGSSAKPRVGSLNVSFSKDDALCTSLIHRRENSHATMNAEDLDLIDTNKLGTGINSDRDKEELLSPLPQEGTGGIWVRAGDLGVSGETGIFYEVNSGHTYPVNYFVVPPKGVSEVEVKTGLSKASGFDGIARVARQLNWTVVGWDTLDVTGSRRGGWYSVIRANNATYLLDDPSDGFDPIYLWKVRRDGSLDEICSFNYVHPNL